MNKVYSLYFPKICLFCSIQLIIPEKSEGKNLLFHATHFCFKIHFRFHSTLPQSPQGHSESIMKLCSPKNTGEALRHHELLKLQKISMRNHHQDPFVMDISTKVSSKSHHVFTHHTHRQVSHLTSFLKPRHVLCLCAKCVYSNFAVFQLSQMNDQTK